MNDEKEKENKIEEMNKRNVQCHQTTRIRDCFSFFHQSWETFAQHSKSPSYAPRQTCRQEVGGEKKYPAPVNPDSVDDDESRLSSFYFSFLGYTLSTVGHFGGGQEK